MFQSGRQSTVLVIVPANELYATVVGVLGIPLYVPEATKALLDTSRTLRVSLVAPASFLCLLARMAATTCPCLVAYVVRRLV